MLIAICKQRRRLAVRVSAASRQAPSPGTESPRAQRSFLPFTRPLVRSWGSVGLCLLLPAAFATPAQGAAAGAGKVDFFKEIRPILSDNCFACHGPDEKERKAKLRLDRREDAFKPAKSGDYAIVPGDLAKSKLIERVMTKDPDEIMPPPKTGKKLTPQQITLLRRWVQEGAKFVDHWSFIKPERPPLPKVKDSDWCRNEIDRFVLARLEKEGLKPSAEADKPTLLRRATLDLTGLPPTLEELDAFLSDKSPTAYQKALQRLLNSARYGEHMARYWLDAARYADSHGYHIDSERSMWKWRDWVVDAFNQNLPFDQFTIEQLAGDLLPQPTPQQKVASGYIRANMTTGEGGVIVDEYQCKYTFDRVETTSTIWLGLTMTCARCHTHKYDPIQQREYYGLYAFFNNLNESVMDGNQPNPDPIFKVPSAEQSRRQAELKKLIDDGQGKMDAAMPEIDRAQTAWQTRWHEKLNANWTVLTPDNVQSTSSNGATFKTLEDKSILAEGPDPETDVYQVTVKLEPGLLAALRLETLPYSLFPSNRSSRSADGLFQLSEFEAEILPPPAPAPSAEEKEKQEKKEKKETSAEGEKGADAKPAKEPEAPKPQPIKFAIAVASTAVSGQGLDKAIDGKADTAWAVETNAAAQPQAAVFALGDPLQVEPGSELRLRLKFEASKLRQAIGHFRIAAAREAGLVQLLLPPKTPPWQVVGPFKSERLQFGFTNVYEPEKEVDLKKAYAGVREEIKWKARPEFEDGKNNLLVQDLHGIHGVYYLYRVVNMTAPAKLELNVRADDAFKLWVNDKLIAERPEKKPNDGLLPVVADLKAGENKLLFKVVTVQGAAYFTYQRHLNDSEGLPGDIAGILAGTQEPAGDHFKRVRYFYRGEHSPEFKAASDTVNGWREEDAAVEKAIPRTMVAKEMDKARDTFLLMRGEYDKKGDKILPGLPSILPPLPAGAPTNRLGLARWLVDPSHPLTARVLVNRFWQQYFGTGFVKTTEDFGVQGEAPSHPELLDWLATEFIRSGWDVKELQRLILTSATYRQTSKANPALRARDPENRLLAHGPRFRVDGEVVRDCALAISGLLIDRRGGRAVKPFEPAGLWEAVSYNNSQKYVPDQNDGQYRRSLYTYWKRQSPPPNMMLFDAPTREYCVVRRPRTNTPLQALALMNDLQFVEASQAFAQRILVEGGHDDTARIRYAFRTATGRYPGSDEIKVLRNLLKQQETAFGQDHAAAEKLLAVGNFKALTSLDRVQLAAWATVASIILNLDETVTKG